MKIYPLLAATMLAPLAGCTTHLESGLARADDPASRQGIAYFLPISRFDATVKWTVTGCDDTDGLILAETIVAKTQTEPDPDALQVIDYTSLNAFTKTSGVKVEFYDSGAIKSINASAEDRTGAIIVHAVSAASKIAAGLIAPGAGGLVAKDTKCSAAVNQALKDVDRLATAVDTATGDLENAQATLEELTARLAQAKSGETDAAVAALKAQVAVVEEKKRALQAAQDNLAPVMKVLTYSDTVSFTASSPNALSPPVVVPEKIWNKWLPSSAGGVALTDAMKKAAAARKSAENAVYLQLGSVGGWQNGVDIEHSGASQSAQRQAGIRYRVAVPASLLGCLGNPCNMAPNAEGTAGKQIGAPMAVRVLNRGSTFYLPFASKGFSNGALEARFAENGTLTYASYDQKTAPGEVIAATADSAADGVVGVIKGIRSDRTSELQQTKDETELLKARQDLALAQAAQAKSPNAANDEETAATEAQTRLLEAKVANANAAIALRKAEAELAAAAPGSAAQ